MTARYRIRLRPSPLALGAARLGAFWQGHSLREGVRMLHAALDSGINLLDTADAYAHGLSERTIALLPRADRERALICTKVGQLKTSMATLRAHAAEGRLSLRSLAAAIPRRTPAEVSKVPRCYDSAYISAAFAGSLKRLRSERVDILLLHSPSLVDLTQRRFEAAATRLLANGDAAHFGVSCDSPEVARAAAELPYVSFVELPLDIVNFDQRALVADLATRGIGVLARSPFGGGSLASFFAARLGAFDVDTQAYCLQSVVRAEGVLSAIVGMSTAHRVHENLALLTREIPLAKRGCIEFALQPRASDSWASARPS